MSPFPSNDATISGVHPVWDEIDNINKTEMATIAILLHGKREVMLRQLFGYE